MSVFSRKKLYKIVNFKNVLQLIFYSLVEKYKNGVENK